MIIYEVNLSIDKTIQAEFQAWLPGHIQEVTACPGFVGAELFTDLAPSESHYKVVVQYRVENQEQLDNYLTQHAPALRQDGLSRFGTQFSATRRILKLETPN